MPQGAAERAFVPGNAPQLRRNPQRERSLAPCTAKLSLGEAYRPARPDGRLLMIRRGGKGLLEDGSVS